MPTKLLIATNNQGKLAELRELLADVPVELITLRDAGIDTVVEETGATFAENAALKAEQYAALSGLWTLADDSGLEVDALDGAPGVYTARYGAVADEEAYRKWRAEQEQKSRADIERLLTAWAELRIVLELASVNQLTIGLLVYG